MGHPDLALKILIGVEPGDFVRLARPGSKVLSVEQLETEIQVVERRMDKLLRVRLEGETELLWLHIEVKAAWASDVPASVFGYWAPVHRTHPNLLSLVLVLRPGDRQGDPRNSYEAWALGKRVLSFGYELVCAWKLEVEELLRIGAPGLLPLVPLARGTSLERVEEAFRATSKAKPDVQVALALLSDWVFPGGDWLAKISEEIRMQSKILNEIEAKGEAKGRREGETQGQRKLLTKLVLHRLGASETTEAFLNRVALADPSTLDQIGISIVDATKEDLVATLDRLLPKAKGPNDK